MKNISLLLCASVVMLFAKTSIQAQELNPVSQPDTLLVSEDTTVELKSFKAKYNSGTVYLEWRVAKQHSNGIYIILRSSDKSNYETVGYLQGVGVPADIDISYYFKDENSSNNVVHYKVLHVGENKSFIWSETITVVTGTEKPLSETRNRNIHQ